MQSLRPLDNSQVFRVMAETSPDAALVVDQTGIVLWLNAAAERLLGYRAEELIEGALAQLVPERLRDTLLRSVELQAGTGRERNEPGTLPLAMLTKDGRELHTELSCGEASHEGHRVFSVIVRNLSDRAAVELALADSIASLHGQSLALEHHVEEMESLTTELEVSNDQVVRLNMDLVHATAAVRDGTRRMRDILDLLSDAVSVFDAEWRWTHINPAAAKSLRALGHDPAAMLGRVLWEELPELVGTRFEREIRSAVETGEIRSYEEYQPALGRWTATRIVPSSVAVTHFTTELTARWRPEWRRRHSEQARRERGPERDQRP